MQNTYAFALILQDGLNIKKRIEAACLRRLDALRRLCCPATLI